jgi:glycosyltransferase involved in cell wall biosynthesis
LPKQLILNLTKLDLIVPCYNPILGWQSNLVKHFEEFKNRNPFCEMRLILVNDGATVGVEEQDIDYLQQNIALFKYIKLDKNQGKGAALRAGIGESEAAFCMFTDIDFPYTTDSMSLILKNLSNEHDIVVGYRNLNYYKNIPFFRKILSKGFRWVLKKIVGMQTDDTQCGLKAFGVKGKEVFLKTQTNRYLFDFEFLKMASKSSDLNLISVPVELIPGITFTSMNLTILLKEALSFFTLIFKK